MSKQLYRGRLAKRRLGVQDLEQRRMLAADVALDFFGGGLAAEVPNNQGGSELRAVDSSIGSNFVAESQGMIEMIEFPGNSLRSELPFGNDALGGGFWMEDTNAINLGGFGGDPMDFNFQMLDAFPGMDMEGLDLEPVPVDMNNEELAAGEIPLFVGQVEFPGMVDGDGMFELIDAGFQSADEVSMEDDHIQFASVQISPQELAKFELELLDQDGDALATVEEIMKSYTQSYGLREAAADGAANGLLTALDSNEDGALDFSELIASYNRNAAQEELDRMDRDGNGTATVTEITTYYLETYGLPEAAASGAAAGLVDAYDSNDDGELDVNELAASYHAYPTQLPANEVIEIMEPGAESPADATSEESADATGVSVKDIQFIEMVNTGDDLVLDPGYEHELPTDATPEEIAKDLGGSVEGIQFIEMVNTDQAIEIDATDAFELDADATPEEFAEALGVSIGDIQFIEMDNTDQAIEIDATGAFEIDADVTLEEIAKALGVSAEDIQSFEMDNLGRAIELDQIGFVDAAGDVDNELSSILDDAMGKVIDSMSGRSLDDWIAYSPSSFAMGRDSIFSEFSDDFSNSELDWVTSEKLGDGFLSELFSTYA